MHLLERRDPKRQKITPADAAKKPDVCWPLVRRHPDTGRLSLYLNPKNTRRVCRLPRSGWPAKAGRTVDEGDAMVRRLAERVIGTGVYAHAGKRATSCYGTIASYSTRRRHSMRTSTSDCSSAPSSRARRSFTAPSVHKAIKATRL